MTLLAVSLCSNFLDVGALYTVVGEPDGVEGGTCEQLTSGWLVEHNAMHKVRHFNGTPLLMGLRVGPVNN